MNKQQESNDSNKIIMKKHHKRFRKQSSGIPLAPLVKRTLSKERYANRPVIYVDAELGLADIPLGGVDQFEVLLNKKEERSTLERREVLRRAFWALVGLFVVALLWYCVQHTIRESLFGSAVSGYYDETSDSMLDQDTGMHDRTPESTGTQLNN